MSFFRQGEYHPPHIPPQFEPWLRLSFTLLRRFQGQKRRLLKTLQTEFENSGVAFQCKRTKTETFENDGAAAHILSAYP